MKAYLLVVILVTLIGGMNVTYLYAYVQELEVPMLHIGTTSEPYTEGSLVFGGDVLLGRGVERLGKGKPESFPFTHVRDIFMSHDRTILNFESAMPFIHVSTADFGMKLSSPSTSASVLQNAGIDIVSLANNHSLDYGEEGILHARERLQDAGIVSVGHGDNDSFSALYVENVGTTKVGYFMYNAVTAYSEEQIQDLLSTLRTTSDFQVACIHWGEEYTKEHNVYQERLARLLIQNGIDVVIGHHPHVTQDVELIEGVPVFYSLGNLVFDQYWSTDVMTGYLVSITLKKDEVLYTLLPYASSLTSRSEPRLLTNTEKEMTLKNLLSADNFTLEEQTMGQLRVERK
jgi:poly-gamma-glutamate synthesis protein (capsule biosynthesis protein)